MQKNNYLSYPELSAFAGQMHLILKAGISAVSGIRILQDDADSAQDKKLLEGIQDAINRTGSLSCALDEAEIFPPYMVHMIKIGEETGNLDRVREQLASHYQRQEEIRRSRINAILYPAILTCILCAVILVLLIQVMPVFDQVFRSLGAQMNGLALALLQIGNAFRRYAVIFLAILAAALVLILFINLTETGRKTWRKLRRHFSGSRERDHDAAAAEFSSTLSMALSSGLTPEQSLDLAAELNEDPAEKTTLCGIREDLGNGISLAESLRNRKMYRGIYAHMAAVGEKTGSLDHVMGEIADLYQEDLDTRINNQLALVEPVLIIVLCVVVGMILLSVMFPLLGILSGM